MAATLLFAAIGFIPQSEMRVDRCDLLMINHIHRNNAVSSYWLGWGLRSDYPVVDWWRHYRQERVWRSDGAYWVQIDGVLVKSKRGFVVVSSYDIEHEQRRELFDRFRLHHKDYRRGLGGVKPQ
jgi:hypothetical protein